jgi:hypothetical protein
VLQKRWVGDDQPEQKMFGLDSLSPKSARAYASD